MFQDSTSGGCGVLIQLLGDARRVLWARGGGAGGAGGALRAPEGGRASGEGRGRLGAGGARGRVASRPIFVIVRLLLPFLARTLGWAGCGEAEAGARGPAARRLGAAARRPGP